MFSIYLECSPCKNQMFQPSLTFSAMEKQQCKQQQHKLLNLTVNGEIFFQMQHYTCIQEIYLKETLFPSSLKCFQFVVPCCSDFINSLKFLLTKKQTKTGKKYCCYCFCFINRMAKRVQIPWELGFLEKTIIHLQAFLVLLQLNNAYVKLTRFH